MADTKTVDEAAAVGVAVTETETATATTTTTTEVKDADTRNDAHDDTHDDAHHDVDNAAENATSTDNSHQPMANRLSLVSWGDGSAPSMPAVDEHLEAELDAAEAAEVDPSLQSVTTTARSSVFDYVEENGRTYHRYKAGKYQLPNDLQEQARLALNFPDATVLGTDLSPIQPAFVPPNCFFDIDDAEDDWSFAHPFDYIHARAITSCFRDPAAVFRSAFAHLVPGGWLEIQDPQFPVKFATPPTDPNSPIQQWCDLISEAAIRIGRPWENTRRYADWMRSADVGFEDVVERTFYWPVGSWPRGEYYKTLGASVLQDLLHGLEALSLKLLGVLGWSPEKIRKLVADARQQVLDPKTHVYFDVVIVYGRKPGGPPLPPKQAKPVPDRPTEAPST